METNIDEKMKNLIVDAEILRENCFYYSRNKEEVINEELYGMGKILQFVVILLKQQDSKKVDSMEVSK